MKNNYILYLIDIQNDILVTTTYVEVLKGAMKGNYMGWKPYEVTCTLSHCIDMRGMVAIRPYACTIIDVVNNIVRTKANSISHMYFSYVEAIEISFYCTDNRKSSA